MPYKDRQRQLDYFREYNAERSESQKHYMSAYNQTRDKESERERHRIYHENNSEKRSVSQKSYRKQNIEYVRQLERASYQRHREEKLARNEAHRQSHREEYNARAVLRSAKRRSLKMHVSASDFTIQQWRAIKLAYAYCCAYCGEHHQRLTQDHVIPLSKGGSHTAGNIVPACRSCNGKKGVNVAPPLVCRSMVVTECP